MNVEYQVTRLPNGVQVATASMPQMASVSCGLWNLAGSRHEREEENGIAHLVEHLLFKGTPSRGAAAIAREIEGLGGSIDAFTAEDHTCYSAWGPAETFASMADVLLDLYSNPTFDPVELERERVVVLEEIAMYRDNPSQHVEELLIAAAWPLHPLGRPITGTELSVNALQRSDLFAFHQRNYHGGNTLVTVSGNISHAEVLTVMADRLLELGTGDSCAFEAFSTDQSWDGPQVELEERRIEQAHVCLGFHTCDRLDPMVHPAQLLNVLLGENMSSLLFQVLREEHGLCYSVASDVCHLHDTGLLTVYVGLESENIPRALDLTQDCFRRLIEREVSEQSLQRAKTYAVAQSRMALESVSQQMWWLGESLLSHQKILPPAEIYSRVARVTAAEIQQYAEQTLRPESMAVAAVGPGLPGIAFDTFLR